ncbi:MAG: DUF2306 domain-containing protein [Pseudomonadota bacterium]
MKLTYRLLMYLAVLIGGWAGYLYLLMSYETHFRLGIHMYGVEATGIQLPKYDADDVRTFMHVLIAPIYLLLGSLQFFRKFRESRPRLHRINGYIVACLALVVAFSANRLAYEMGLGKWQELVPTVLFSSLFIIFLAIAIYNARKKNYEAHREWMMRHYAIALAAGGTIRVLLVSSHLVGLGTEASIATVFWVSFLLNLSIAELYINYSRKKRLKSEARPVIEGGLRS